jgi:hypothetical protein
MRPMALGDLRNYTLGLPSKPQWIRALHLSDAHFTPETFAKDQGASGAKSSRFQDRLLSELRRAKGTEPIHLLLMTGDLVDSEMRDEDQHDLVLRKSKDFLDKLCSELAIPDAGRVYIPGNHDMKWHGLFGEHDHVRPPSWNPLKWFGKKPPRAIPQSRRTQIFRELFPAFDEHRYYPELDLLIGCFDSNDAISWGELATGAVNLASVDKLVQELNQWAQERRPLPNLRLALVHHHPLPVPPAEFLFPGKHWMDRSVGKRVEGAPEMMLLRNGGTFIQRLIAEGFQAVLHGHLHCRNYWGPVYGINSGSHWLEVISGPSLCANAEDHHSFGMLEISTTNGSIRYQNHSFKIEGQLPELFQAPTMNYERVRDRLRQKLSSRDPWHCVNHHKMWDVHLPEGDLFTTEIYHQLKNVSEKAISSLVMPARSAALTRQEFYADIPQKPDRVKVSAKPTQHQGEARVEYTLTFTPAIEPNEEFDLIIRRRSDGIVFCSREAQECWGVDDAQLGHDYLLQTVWMPTDRLQETVRFHINAQEAEGWQVPVNVWAAVNRSDSPSEVDQAETELAKKSCSYWTVRRLPGQNGSDANPLAEAILSIHAPLTRYRYSLKWKLPPEDPISERKRADIKNLRKRLVLGMSVPDRKAKMRELLTWCLDQTREKVRTALDDSRWEDETMHACLFTMFSPEPQSDDGQPEGNPHPKRRPAEMIPLVATADGSALAGTTLRWGRDIIGRSARQGRTVSMDRQKIQIPVEILHTLPAQVQLLIAKPVFCHGPDRYPCAVVALASTRADSGLKAIIHTDEAKVRVWREELERDIQAVWSKNFNEIVAP